MKSTSDIKNMYQSDRIKTVQDSKTEQVYVVHPQHINPQGRLSGVCLMQWIDVMGGIVSRRHSGKMVTTAMVDSMNFKAGAFQNDMVVLTGKLTFVGHTSMEVRVDTYIEDCQGKRKNINTAFLVMVALDANGNPAIVPGIQIETEEEQEEWLRGQKRYQLRKTRRIEGY